MLWLPADSRRFKLEADVAKAKTIKVKVGRDAETGEFIPVKEAERRKKSAVVETIERPAPKPKKGR